MQEWHLRIERGEIDKGPPTDQTDAITDIRDLRDPTVIGSIIQEHRIKDRASFNPFTASEIYDRIVRGLRIPLYSSEESTVHQTVYEYREKMQRQAAQGDVHACVVLLQKGWALPEDVDPALAERASKARASRPEEE